MLTKIKKALKKLLKAPLSKKKWNSLVCSLCNKDVDQFNPLPDSYLEHLEKHFIYGLDKFETLNIREYSCPICGSCDRDRLYALYIKKILSAKSFQSKHSPPKLLDIAPSEHLANWVKKLGTFNYRSCDLYMDNVDDKIDITNMKEYADHSFDALICSHVLEHVADDKKAVKEIFRVLSPGGWAILMAPISLAIQTTHEDPTITDGEQRWKYYAQNDHVRLYSKQGFVDLIKNAGFHLQQLTINDFENYAFMQHGIESKSVLYIATKPHA